MHAFVRCYKLSTDFEKQEVATGYNFSGTFFNHSNTRAQLL